MRKTIERILAAMAIILMIFLFFGAAMADDFEDKIKRMRMQQDMRNTEMIDSQVDMEYRQEQMRRDMQQMQYQNEMNRLQDSIIRAGDDY